MNTIEIRKKLHHYNADATDSKAEGMYLLLKDEISQQHEFQLTAPQIEILWEER